MVLRWGDNWQLVVACLSLSMVSIWLIFAGIAYETYTTAWREADLFAANVARLLEKGLARDIDVYDLALQALARNAANEDVMKLPIPLQRMALFDATADARGMGGQVLVDRFGNVLLDSQRAEARFVNVANRPYFIAQKAGSVDQPYVSHPLLGLLSHDYLIMLSRPRLTPTGQFDGVVFGSIRVDYLQSIFSSLSLPEDSTIALLHQDGTILARVPDIGQGIGLGYKAPRLSKLVVQGAEGPIIVRSRFDGIERLIAYHQIGHLPIYMTVGLSTKEFIGRWRLRIGILGLSFLGLSAMILSLGFMLTRELNRRTVAERTLAELAATDALTGLANRRSFDETLRLEWRRAKREAKPISLLMIDGDWFKSFNDTYGHVEGDEALRRIGEALRRAVRRPGDLAARYGGEEFAVLLPDTDLQGAADVANGICRYVTGLAVPHGGSSLGILTVSIGVASRVALLHEEVETLVEAADRALYQAKAEGRGRVVLDTTIADEGGLPRMHQALAQRPLRRVS